MRKRLALVLLLLQGLMTPGGGIGTGDISKDDFPKDDFPQIPTQSPHTLERACTTKLGFCRVANLTPPGQPCYCLTAAGGRVDGYVIAYRFSEVPSVVK
jgi:hypothetical protein